MRKSFLFIFLILLSISCKQKVAKTNFEENTSTFSKQKNMINRKENFSDEVEKLEEISLPYCMKTSDNAGNYYYGEIDTFLTYHKFKKNLNPQINNKFHLGTEDFWKGDYMVYPYEKDEEDSNPFAIKKLKNRLKVIRL